MGGSVCVNHLTRSRRAQGRATSCGGQVVLVGERLGWVCVNCCQNHLTQTPYAAAVRRVLWCGCMDMGDAPFRQRPCAHAPNDAANQPASPRGARFRLLACCPARQCGDYPAKLSALMTLLVTII